jgi:hypothetical protein
MAATPKVSVLTPTYNHERFLGPCIESVLSQSFEDWEMVILDDGSTDGTPFLARRYDDPRIRYLRQTNRGIANLGENYNTLLDESRGELVAILEGDDYWPSDKLEVQVRDFRDSGTVLSGGLVQVVDDEGTELMVSPVQMPASEVCRNTPVGRAAVAMLDPLVLTFTFPVTVVMRKSALESVGGFRQPEGLPLVDFPTFLVMALQGEWRFHDRVLGHWRRHGASTTLASAGQIFNGVYAHIEEFLEEHRLSLPATGEEIAAIDRKWQHFQAERLISLGRQLAARGRGGDARRAFRQALRFRLRQRTRAMVRLASILVAVGRSPEAAFRMSARGAQMELDLQSGDTLITDAMRPEEIVPRRLN